MPGTTAAAPSLLLLLVAGCSGGGAQPLPTSSLDAGTPSPPARFSSSALEGAGAVSEAVALHRDGSAALVLVVALEAGGLASFRYAGGPTGKLAPLATALPGRRVTGLSAARFDAAGTEIVVAYTDDQVLHGLDAEDLHELTALQVANLATPGAVAAGDQDGDGDDDFSLFRDDWLEITDVETRGGRFVARDHGALPVGIEGVTAGPLGGNAADEYIFLGRGLVEALTTGPFNYTDLKLLSGAPHARAAFGDFDADGSGDLAVTTEDSVELWQGDGQAGLGSSPAASVTLAPPVDVAALPRGKGGMDATRLVAVSSDGSVAVIQLPAMTLGADAFLSSDKALRILGGDVDGDGVMDALVISSDGVAYLWRDPR